MLTSNLFVIILAKVIHKLPTPFLKKNTNMFDTKQAGGGIYQSPRQKQFNSNYI